MLTIQKRFSAFQAATMSIGVLSIGFVGSLATLNLYHPGRNNSSPTGQTLSSIAPSVKTTAMPLGSSGSDNSTSNSAPHATSVGNQPSRPGFIWPQSTYQSRPSQTVQPASNPVPTAVTPAATPAIVPPLVPLATPTQSGGGTTPAVSTPPAATPLSVGVGLSVTPPVVSPTLPTIPLAN